MAAAGQGEKIPASGMLAVKAPLAEIEALIESSRLDVVLANRNAPQQGVIAGTLAALDTVRSICRDKGYSCMRLPVATAFHSNCVKEARHPFRKALRIDCLLTNRDTGFFQHDRRSLSGRCGRCSEPAW